LNGRNVRSAASPPRKRGRPALPWQDIVDGVRGHHSLDPRTVAGFGRPADPGPHRLFGILKIPLKFEGIYILYSVSVTVKIMAGVANFCVSKRNLENLGSKCENPEDLMR